MLFYTRRAAGQIGLRQVSFWGVHDPRRMITRCEAQADGELLFAAELRNRTSANPYIGFIARLKRTTAITFLWWEEDGREYRATRQVTVT
ncbi:thiosulfate oxidation carrier complex protein SoxZ [Phreatobacter sp. HK31-P]